MEDRENPSAVILTRLFYALKRLEVKKYFASFSESYFSDEKWVKNNFPALLEKFPDTWIVVCHENVIFSHESRKEVDKFMADKGYTPKDVVIRFVTNRIPIFRWTGRDFHLTEGPK
jgi:hypothetical protein